MTTPTTVAALFLDRVQATPDAAAYASPSEAGWRWLTWREVGAQVAELAAGLRALGLEDEGRVALLAGTRLEWVLADLAILCAGGATTTIYPSSTAGDCAYILTDSGSRIVFAEDQAQIDKLLSHRAELGDVARVVVFDGVRSADGWVITLDDLRARGRELLAADAGAFERVARAVTQDRLATLIYTSGTTGRPKGVELTHDCWVYTGEAIAALGLLTPDDVQFLWLPLAHSFGKVLEAAQLAVGFRTAIDGRVDKIVDNLSQVRPTFVAAVPRIFEKVRARVLAGVAEGSGMKRRIFRWAMGVGRRTSELARRGERPGLGLRIAHAVASRLVFSKLQARFGGRLRFFISGSAPLARELAEFFHAADILILEGYGLTETSAASFVNRPSAFRFGTVGPPVPGTELRLAPEDGEILIKSRGVMRGYHHLPEATAECLTSDGWLRTGDIGHLEDGFLRITDRKKDLIKTSGGKYVAPQALEGRLKLACPYVSQVLVHGNNRNFCTALVALDPEAIGAWARDNALGALPYPELVAHPRVHALVAGHVEALNRELASYETIKKFAILPADLTVDSGELTPSLKLKRKVVEARYQPMLDAFYGGDRG